MDTYKCILFCSLICLSSSFFARTKIFDQWPSFKKHISMLLPQGWAEFATSSTTPMFSTYKLENEKWRPITICNSDVKNTFGLSRYARRIELESMILFVDTPDLSWSSNFSEQAISSDRCLNQIEINPIIKNLQPGIYKISQEFIISHFEFRAIAFEKDYFLELKPYESI